MIYIFGSLSNKEIPVLTKRLTAEGHKVFSEWFGAGPEADSHWKQYFADLGLSYREALETDFVNTAFNFDLEHMQQADTGVLVMPAGRSGHLELGWMLGQGKRGYILFPDGEPERPDLMSKLATKVLFSVEELIEELKPSSHQLDQVVRAYLGICTSCGTHHGSDECPRPERTDWGV